MLRYGFGALTYIYLIIIFGLTVLSIYALILFIKLSKRGIKALDIYLEEKNNNNYN